MVKLLPKEHHIYCDESSTGSRFIVYGGIVLPTRDLESFEDLVAAWRTRYKMDDELKWGKVSSGKYAEYQAFVDFYFKNRHRDGLHFKSMICDTQSPGYIALRKEKPDTAYYILYYYFLLKKFGPYAKDNDHSLSVILDERSTAYNLTDLKKFLNISIRNECRLDRDVISELRCCDSKNSNAMQLADVLMGALAWEYNDLGTRPDASKAKNDLAAHLAKRLRIKSLRDHTEWRNPLFEKWIFKFTGQPRPNMS